MKKWIVFLSGVLVAQLVLTVFVYVSDDDYGAYETNEKLLVFDVDTVDRIHIADSENNATLTKHNEKWVLQEQNDFPADQNSVRQLLDKLTAMKRGWPIATTSGASRRFKVDEDEFERKLSLFANKDTLAQLYIGDSPGFRKVHVRKAGDDEVFAVDFNTWEASANSADWIDKHILAFAADDLLRVEMPDFVLQRENDELQLTDVDNQEKINQSKIQEFTNSLSGLQVDSLSDGVESAKLSDAADVTFNLTLVPDNRLVYHFYKLEDEPYYLLERSDLDVVFKVAEFYVDTVKETTRDQLILTETEDELNDNNGLENIEFVD